MTERYQGKYRSDSARLSFWDYGSNAIYFITICTKNREHFFGEIAGVEVILNEIGEIAHQCWLEIPKHFPFVKLGNHVIMPNHTHGIVIIDKPTGPPLVAGTQNVVGTQNIASLRQPPGPPPIVGPPLVAGTQNIASLRPGPIPAGRPPAKNQFGPQSQNLASIIRGFKIGVTKNARLINPNFCWQPRFHDHIIRDDESFHNISQYIKNNPMNWKEDEINNPL